MKKAILPIALLVVLGSLSGLIGNMVSDDVESFLSNQMGSGYIWILCTLLILSLSFTIWITYRQNQKNNSQNPEGISYESTDRILIEVDQGKLQKIKAALKEAELIEAAELMSQIAAFEREALTFTSRLNKLNKEKGAGIRTVDAIVRDENAVREAMLDLIYRTGIKEEEVIEETLIPTLDTFSSQTVLQKAYRKIADENDRILNLRRDLIGRGTLLKEFHRTFNRKGAHAVLVCGAAGIGKTAFCKTVIRKLIQKGAFEHFYWIDIEQLPSAYDIQVALCSMMQIDAQSNLEQLFKVMEENGSTLIYLDNLETVLGDEQSHTLLEALLKVNNVHWLASSREFLQPWKRLDLNTLEERDAEKLFREEWKNHSGNTLPAIFTQDQQQFLFKELGGYPLAIILTASHPTYPGLDALIADWRKEEKLLLKRYGGQKRHRLDDLDYSINLSLQRLQKYPGCIRLWEIMIFFPNGMNDYFQETMIRQGIFKREDIERLHCYSIIELGSGKLWMLPPLVRFARWQIQEKNTLFDLNTLYTAGEKYILELAPDNHIEKPPDWLKRLAFTFAFMEFFVPHLSRYKTILSIHDKLFNYYKYDAFTGKRILSNLLKNVTGDELGYANVLSNLGQLEFLLGNNDSAKDYYVRARKLYEKTGDELGHANVLSHLGELEFRLGNNDLAKDYYVQARKLYEKTGSEQGHANVLSNLGELEFRLGNNDSAKDYYVQARKLYEKTGDELGYANVLSNLGQLEFLLGNNDSAKDYYVQARKLYEKTGSEQGHANVLSNLGQLEFLLGNNDSAKDYYVQARKLYEKTGDELGHANVLSNLGELEFRLGNNDLAKDYYVQARKLYEKTGDELGHANVLSNLGQLEFLLGNNDSAKDYYVQARKLYEKTGSELGQANINHFLAVIHDQGGDLNKAHQLWSTALIIYKKIGMKKDIAKTEIYLAKLEKRQGLDEKAASRINRAQQIAEALNNEWLLGLIAGDEEE